MIPVHGRPTTGTMTRGTSVPVGYHSFAAAGSVFVYDTTTNALVEAPASVHHALEVCRRKALRPLAAGTALRFELSPAHWREATSWLQDAGRQGMFRPYRTRDYTWLLDQNPSERLTYLGGLVLGLTERCNFRCGYCVYSGHYRGRRVHSARSMTWLVVKRSLDFFLPRAKGDSWVSFYGGEPALEWDLVERAIRYLHRRRGVGSRMPFHFTTNGSIIDARKLDFIIEHNGSLGVSLDGPACVHDRARRFRNGAGSFERVMRSLDLMCSRDEGWYRSHVSFDCVICRRKDLPLVLDFYGTEDLVRDMPVKATGVQVGIDPSQATALELGPTTATRSLALPEAYLASLAGRSSRCSQRLFTSLFRPVFDQLARRHIGLAPARSAAHAMCYPGTARLYVDVGGGLYACNRLDIADGRIGDVEHGFDYDRVRKLLRFFVEYCQSACRECWAQRLCSFCAVRGQVGGTLQEEQLARACREIRERWKHWLLVFAYLWKREEELGVTDQLHSLHRCVKEAQREHEDLDPDAERRE
jgi:uncharacterized protein